MSPEQAAGHHSQLDTRTDVFSLGVVLYELLTGQTPHGQSESMFDLLQKITEGKIRRPRQIDRSIDVELEAILLKALAQNPEDRYASAGALAKDIVSSPSSLCAMRHFLFECKYSMGSSILIMVRLSFSLR